MSWPPTAISIDQVDGGGSPRQQEESQGGLGDRNLRISIDHHPGKGSEQEVGLLSSSSTPRSWEPLDRGGVVMPYGGGGGRRGAGVWGRACHQEEV